MHDEGISISLLESYRFWKRWAAMKKGMTFPVPYHEWLNKYGNECPICDGTPARTWSDGIVRYCACSVQKLLSQNQEMYQEWQSPYHSMALEALRSLHNPPDLGDNELTKTIHYIKKIWLATFPGWMYIYGGRGVGKTHMLQAIRTILPKGLTIYITAGDYRASLFAAQREDGKVDELFKALSTTPILLFDDWGMEYQKVNDWAGSTFENIIDRRSNHPDYFVTVVTSNKSDAKQKESSDDNVLRSISRLCNPAYSRVLNLSQADFRDRLVQDGIQ